LKKHLKVVIKSQSFCTEYLLSDRTAASGLRAIRFATLHVSTHNKIYSFWNTNTNKSTSNRNTMWQCKLKVYHKHLTKSLAKQYRNVELRNITPQATLLQVAQKLPHKPPAKTNKKAPLFWHLNTSRNLIPTKTAESNFLNISFVRNGNVSWMQNVIWINFNIPLIMFYYQWYVSLHC
jgi:hypothetical protein